MKEIGFPQVGGWLLFKVSSGQSYSAVEETYGMGCGGRDKDITRLCSSHSKTTTEKAEHVRRKAGNPPSTLCECHTRLPGVTCHPRCRPGLFPMAAGTLGGSAFPAGRRGGLEAAAAEHGAGPGSSVGGQGAMPDLEAVTVTLLLLGPGLFIAMLRGQE